MPRFIRHPDLTAVAWLICEAVIRHIDKRMDQIMGTLVTVDSDVLGALTTLSQTVDSEIGTLVEQGKLAPADVSGIQTALTDAKSQLDAAVSSGTATSPTDPTTPPTSTDPTSTTPPADTSTAPPADTSTTPPADTSTDAPVDPNAPLDIPSADPTA